MQPTWIRTTLIGAGIYNLVWGAWVILFPTAVFHWLEIELPRYPQIWQCVGMIVGVYGIGYLIAARDAYRHWPIVLVGFLGKLFGPLGFLVSAIQGELPWRWSWILVTNDFIWWVPFAGILYATFRKNSDCRGETVSLSTALNDFVSHRGATLSQLSSKAPTLVVFLRHSGCTFCREMLSDLAAVRGAIEAKGYQLALVHMGRPMRGTQMTTKYGLEDLHRFSDMECQLYHAFGLPRGTASQLIGPQVIRRAVPAILNGHGIGTLAGDGFRMPGIFLIVDGQIRASHVHRTAAERVDFLEFLAANSMAISM